VSDIESASLGLESESSFSDKIENKLCGEIQKGPLQLTGVVECMKGTTVS